MTSRDDQESAERARTARELASARRMLFIIFVVGTVCVFAAVYFVVKTLPAGSLDAAKHATGYAAPLPSAVPAPKAPPR